MELAWKRQGSGRCHIRGCYATARPRVVPCRVIVNDTTSLLPAHTYAISVLEQVGDSIVGDHYWDYGLFSNLYQLHRPVPADASLCKVLAQQDCERWASLLPRLHGHLEMLCPLTVQAAYVQV
jgi:hypothetical protein